MIKIADIDVVDKLISVNKEARYEVALFLITGEKGPYVGRSGSIVKQLEAQCQIKVDFWYTDGRQIRPL